MKYRITATSLILLFSWMSLSAQSPTAIPGASELTTAKTIYLAYAGAPMGINWQIPTTQLVVTDLQRALLTNGRYTQVAKPADADLSLRLSIEGGLIRLAIFDTKTGALLWTIDEGIEGANRKETAIKNLNDAAVRIVSDLEALASGTTVAAPQPTTAPTK
jgi:hypothetical protein